MMATWQSCSRSVNRELCEATVLNNPDLWCFLESWNIMNHVYNLYSAGPSGQHLQDIAVHSWPFFGQCQVSGLVVSRLWLLVISRFKVTQPWHMPQRLHCPGHIAYTSKQHTQREIDWDWLRLKPHEIQHIASLIVPHRDKHTTNANTGTKSVAMSAMVCTRIEWKKVRKNCREIFKSCSILFNTSWFLMAEVEYVESSLSSKWETCAQKVRKTSLRFLWTTN